MKEAGTVPGVSNIIHLWQGKALDSSGTIYTLDGETATVDGTAGVGNLTQLSASTPFWQQDGIQLYYHFTLYQGQKIDRPS